MTIAVVGTGWTRTGSSADSASAEDLAGAAELLVEKSIGSSCGGGGNCGRCWPDVGGGGGSIIRTANNGGEFVLGALHLYHGFFGTSKLIGASWTGSFHAFTGTAPPELLMRRIVTSRFGWAS